MFRHLLPPYRNPRSVVPVDNPSFRRYYPPIMASERSSTCGNTTSWLLVSDDGAMEVTAWPKPVQSPMPMWGAAISEASFVRYGKLGWPILTFPTSTPPEKLKKQFELYRETYLEHGHPPDNMRIAPLMFTYLSRQAEESNEAFDRAMGDYFSYIDALTGSAETEQRLYDRSPTTARLSGNPSQAIYALMSMRDDLGITDVVNVTHFGGGLTHEQTLNSIELFAREVMPAFCQDSK